MSEARPGETPSDTIYFGDYGPGSTWDARVRQQQAMADDSKATVALFGDSHVERFPAVRNYGWQKQWRRSLNLGISGDGTRQMISRVRRGLFDTFKPQKLVVSVGTNNLNNPSQGGTDAQVQEGIATLVRKLREKLPDTQIVLIGLLPRTTLGIDRRTKVLNAYMRNSADKGGFVYVDVYDRFVKNPAFNGQVLIGTTSHYTPRGYESLGRMLTRVIFPGAYLGP